MNATLLSLSSQLTSNDATVAQNKAQLAAITRATYETSGSNQVLAAVLSAPSFNQAMDELKSANQVSQQVLALVAASRQRGPGDHRRADEHPHVMSHRRRRSKASSRRKAISCS